MNYKVLYHHLTFISQVRRPYLLNATPMAHAYAGMGI